MKATRCAAVFACLVAAALIGCAPPAADNKGHTSSRSDTGEAQRGGAAQGARESVAPASVPSLDTRRLLTDVSLSSRTRSVTSLTVIGFPHDSIYAGLASEERPLAVPIQARQEIVIQLRPDLSRDELGSFLKQYETSAVSVIPELNVLVIQLTEGQVGAAPTAVESVKALNDLPLNRVIERMRGDHRVISATPNSVLSPFELKSAVVPIVQRSAALAESGEQEDWGMANANIPQVWPMLKGAIKVGVIDGAFGLHDDLKIIPGLDIPLTTDDPKVPVSALNHGTHIAGILCAQHNDHGVRGVLPNCTVVASPSRSLLRGDANRPQGDGALAWSTFFSEYVGTVMDFVRANPDIKVINLSLGYNWLPNFNKDPRSDPDIRDIVEGQGRIYESMLEYAADRGIAVVSAAGNDSSTLAQPLEAKWASPFNFGSALMAGVRGWSNGLIVQSHDKLDNRAPSSNVAADISCPGVEVLSTLANPTNSLGLLSGTSMAAPYCAGALLALRTVLPDLDLRTAMRCIKNSNKFVAGVPKLDLMYAIAHCQAKSVGADEHIEALHRWTGYLADANTGSSSQTPGDGGCKYGLKEVFPVAALDAQQVLDPSVRARVGAYLARLRSDNCSEPILIFLNPGSSPEARRQHEFASAVLSEIAKQRYLPGAMMVEWSAFGLMRGTDTGPPLDKILLISGDDELEKQVVSAPMH